MTAGFLGEGSVASSAGAGNDEPVGRVRGWPVSLTEPSLLDAPVGLRPVRVRDARVWRDSRVRNASWLRPWEPTNPETPLFRSGLSPYIAMARTMRREARQGQALPWVITYGGRFAGQLTVGSIVWGSARSGQVGYWIDEAMAGRGDPDRASDGDRLLLPYRRAAPAGSEHPAGESREPPGGGKTGIPGRGLAPPFPAYRRRLAGPLVLCADRRGCPRRPAATLAGHAVGVAFAHCQLIPKLAR